MPELLQNKFIITIWSIQYTGQWRRDYMQQNYWRRYTLQIHCTENSKQIFPEMKLRGLVPNFHIHVSVSDLYIPMIGPPILLQKLGGPIVGIFKSLTDT
jgi:hypothetical protein